MSLIENYRAFEEMSSSLPKPDGYKLLIFLLF